MKLEYRKKECFQGIFISYSQKYDTININTEFMNGTEGKYMQEKRSPEDIENESSEYTPWQKSILTFLRWGAWATSFMAIAHMMEF
jgi:hypothetical protein